MSLRSLILIFKWMMKKATACWSIGQPWLCPFWLQSRHKKCNPLWCHLSVGAVEAGLECNWILAVSKHLHNITNALVHLQSPYPYFNLKQPCFLCTKLKFQTLTWSFWIMIRCICHCGFIVIFWLLDCGFIIHFRSTVCSRSSFKVPVIACKFSFNIRLDLYIQLVNKHGWS